MLAKRVLVVHAPPETGRVVDSVTVAQVRVEHRILILELASVESEDLHLRGDASGFGKELLEGEDGEPVLGGKRKRPHPG